MGLFFHCSNEDGMQGCMLYWMHRIPGIDSLSFWENRVPQPLVDDVVMDGIHGNRGRFMNWMPMAVNENGKKKQNDFLKLKPKNLQLGKGFFVVGLFSFWTPGGMLVISMSKFLGANFAVMLENRPDFPCRRPCREKKERRWWPPQCFWALPFGIPRGKENDRNYPRAPRMSVNNTRMTWYF